MQALAQPPAARLTAQSLLAAVAVVALAATLLLASPAEAGQRTSGSVAWGDRALDSSNGDYAVSGRVSGGRGRTVRLQVRWDDGWHTFDRTRTRTRGRFRLTGELGWYGAHRVRLTVAPTHRFSGRTFEPTTFTVKRLWQARGGRSAHRFFRYDRKNFAWNPWNTITYRVNPGRAGDRAIAFTKEAVRRGRRCHRLRVHLGRPDHQGAGPTRWLPLPERDHAPR
jgi:hypothetical protein